MTWDSFTLSVEDHVAHLVLNRPEKRNALSRAFWTELPQAVQALDDGAQARVILISSTGPYFSSGIDIAMLGSLRPDMKGPDAERRARLIGPLTRYEGIVAFQRSFSSLEQCRLPVIAAVQGGCIGAGLDLLSACCIRYATSDAFFSVYEINVGMPADMGTLPRLTRFLPEGVVRELAYTGRRMDAREAHFRGLVNEVFDDHNSLLDKAKSVAREIASKAPIAIAGTKRLINYGRDHSTADTLDHVALWIAGMNPSEQILDAARANAGRASANFADLPVRTQFQKSE
ncbi:enoyl-CoA hydratase-related protein [Cupriavidus metallidurans]|uniref:Enoyl-CoA hydratase/isomerase n=1 Tax=Cupriavidus metallidurans (strain ATCC 43123 / DSM 2839 / NBRC 102507 / CH34) TaxID=266264 RepID=Q1LBV5_CUPMC|nr:enoyl-CoA hydratase-related protein [Cupriavidus metallidurans]ABF12371.1 Enoyl-CoA hydratase/isomerase [Cupriavidus metallidurans CH34]QGS32399.1 enoyl-CoA hydratase [Cupriavidus metallidurans]